VSLSDGSGEASALVTPTGALAVAGPAGALALDGDSGPPAPF
jgi:hypothetical protein